MEMIDGYLPFIETTQYNEFVRMCDYILHTRKIGLVSGLAGAGKSWAAFGHVLSQPLMIANGRPPYHYMHLSQGEKTDRTLLNALVSSMTGQPRRMMSSGDAMDEAIRLWLKFGYEMLIIDEILALQTTGIEAIRTFHDRGPHVPRIPVVMITVPYITRRLQHDRYEAFYSRIGQILHFDSLNKDQVAQILEHIPANTPLKFKNTQEDASEIIDTLYTGAGGGVIAKARFRVIDDILNYCDVELRERIVEWRDLEDDNKPPKPRFDVALIKEIIPIVQSGKHNPMIEQRPKKEAAV